MTVVAAAPQSNADAGENECRRGAEHENGAIEGLCLFFALRRRGFPAHGALRG